MAVALLCAPPAHALPTNFNEVVVFNNLDFPVAVRFSPDGRAFIAEKSGVVKVYDNIFDPSPSVWTKSPGLSPVT